MSDDTELPPPDDATPEEGDSNVREFPTPDALDSPGPVKPDHKASGGGTKNPFAARIQAAREKREKGQQDSGSSARRTKTATPQRRTPPRSTRAGELVKPLEELYASLGILLMPLDQVCATAVVDNAHDCAVALDNLARQNDAVRRVLLAVTATSAWGGAVTAHLPILLVVAVHHGNDNMRAALGPVAVLLNARKGGEPADVPPGEAGERRAG